MSRQEKGKVHLFHIGDRYEDREFRIECCVYLRISTSGRNWKESVSGGS